MKKAIVVTAVNTLVMTLVVQRAHATPGCGCPEEIVRGADFNFRRVAPQILHWEKRRLRVPLNLEWRTHEMPDPSLVFEPVEGGDPIGLTTEMGEAGVFVVRPERALSVFTIYRFAGVEIETDWVDDTTPPVLTGVQVQGESYSGACPSAIEAKVTTSSVTDDTTSGSLIVYRVEVQGENSEKIIYLPPRVQAGSQAGIDDLAPAFGSSPDFCPNSFPDATLDEDFTVIVSAFDLAGNESVRHGPIQFRFAETDAAYCGCSSTASGFSKAQLLWSFALLLLVVAMRRRTRSRGSES